MLFFPVAFAVCNRNFVGPQFVLLTAARLQSRRLSVAALSDVLSGFAAGEEGIFLQTVKTLTG